MNHIFKHKHYSWDQQIHNNVHEIHSLVGKTLCSYVQNLKDRVVLTRCRTSHGRCTHSYLLAMLFVLTVKIARIRWSSPDVVLVMVDLLIVIGQIMTNDWNVFLEIPIIH